MGKKITRRKSIMQVVGIGATIPLLAEVGSASDDSSSSPNENDRHKGAKALGQKTKEMFDRRGRPVSVQFPNPLEGNTKSYDLSFKGASETIRVESNQPDYNVEMDGETFTLNEDELKDSHEENQSVINDLKKQSKQEYLSNLEEIMDDKGKGAEKSSKSRSGGDK